MANKSDQLLSQIEDIALVLQKAQVNLKKCPKQRLTRGYIQTRLQSVDDYWNTYKQLHQELVRCIPKEKKSEMQYFTNEEYYIYEDIYLSLQADLRDLLSTMSVQTREDSTPNASSASAGCNLGEEYVGLPKIILPTFSGNYEEWLGFHDLFTSVVHNNQTVSKVRKLHYLKTSLTGEAASLLKNLQVTENNYEQAWALLKGRYGNKRLIVNTLLKRLFSQKKMSAQTSHLIKSLVDTTNECINSLKNLNIITDSWDPLIIFLVVQKLDQESHRDWEEYAYKENSEELPKWEDLMKFLNIKFRTLELVNPPSREKAIKNKEHTVLYSTAPASTTQKARSCPSCKENHTLCHCKEFTELSPPERCEYLKKNNLCFNCMAPGHTARRCRLNMNCRICNRRHHTLVHQAASSQEQLDKVNAHHNRLEEISNKDDEEEEEHLHLTSHFAAHKSTALLATALVPVRDKSGRVTILRALVDQGSQATFISERAAQRLKLNRTKVKGTITGIGTTTTSVKHAAELEILSSNDDTFRMKVKAYILTTRLTSQLPSRSISTNTWKFLEGLVLADPNFQQPGRIDMLLGVDVCSQIMKGEVIRGPPGLPCAQNTTLGWILFGNIEGTNSRDDFVVMHLNIDLEDMLKTMWELNDDEKGVHTPEEKRCEELYQATHTRSDDGRYIVKLPTKNEDLLSTKGDTRNIALKRFNQLERRFDKNPKLKEEYCKVMAEYIELNHMEEVPNTERDNPAVYLPHRAVIREDKETTKMRTVFNASQKGSNNISLNDELLNGPQLQDDMRSLIMKWRMKRKCYVADIQKMYRQILVTKEDRDLQRVIWRPSSKEPIKDYRLLTVTFGTASAPYLAVKTLHQVADDEGYKYPNAAKVIKQDFYMDDLMSGADTLDEAIKTAKEVEYILRQGGFVLQKWCSNNAEFLKKFEPTKRSTHVNVELTIDGTIKALGLQWNMGKDIFQYTYRLPLTTNTVSKRIILAEIQKLFDPLGWLAPAILPAKLLIQQLWLQGISWDEEINTDIKEQWIKFRDCLQKLNGIEIPRWIHTTDEIMKDITIHGFCDASTKAYAGVVYIRVKSKNGEIHTEIIAAKTRVAPVKPVTLPRLELCGALLLSRLLKQIKNALNLPSDKIFAWTDSTIVLSWLLGDPGRWQTFVRNRVVEIIDNTGKNWYHVQTRENPADTASRGTTISNLKENELWWNGPKWLKDEEIDYWRPNNLTTDDEKRNVEVNLKIQGAESVIKFENFDTLRELTTTITYAKRFLKGMKLKNKTLPLTTNELDKSLKTCIKKAQLHNFADDIFQIKKHKYVKGTSRLKSLQPYLDDDGILRVGGRLRHADLPDDAKHPIILDSDSAFTSLIVADAHIRTLHGGLQLMLTWLRTKYWILKIKNLCKMKIHRCLICARQNAKARDQLMGDLPSARVSPARAFLHCGVDFAGPFQVLMSKGRGAKSCKAYVALFVCMATKAIHLELVGDLSSEAFIGAFRRFVSRRGRCAHLWSDQGRNFIGANKELAKLWAEANLSFETSIAETLAHDGTQWHFIPAYTPHMGGLWEAGVKSMKFHLKRVLSASLTFEDMTTLLCQIEACLNSRPLCPIEPSDPDHLTPLTPGHFLIGDIIITVPSPDLSNIPMNRLSRWQHLQKLLQDFWTRWQEEYLSRLQQRPKWLNRITEFEIGHIVLIKSEHLPPGKWALGRIVAKHTGLDGVTRVYSVKSGDTIVKRCVNKLCYLPIDIE